ncbi:MAG: lipid asymmetry maintenance ABC transporter permease subunit MlaE [Gammaproteobacteria bacterium]|nr:lipid asymmetry maintenance ABC transporter permease subunit MlaE [Gammaproteobacteria bacterium]
MHALQTMGHVTLQVCDRIGSSGLMLTRALWRKPQPLKSFPLLIEQLHSVGVLSLVIIIVSGVFIGMVVTLQGHHTLTQFGASAALGQLLALSVVRELGPVVTALLFAGRAGSALTAEIGLMKTTEQLNAMEMIGVDPLWRIISPRFWAGMISMPLLTLIFNAVAVLGGYMVAVQWLGVDGGTFWSNMQASVNFQTDIANGVIKSIIFGMVITWVAVYQGYACQPTAEGIGRSTTKTVVYSSLAILGLDFILTAMMMGGW